MSIIVDSTIGNLPAATTVNSNDLLVMEQAGKAKKLSGGLLESHIQNISEDTAIGAVTPFVQQAEAAAQNAAAAATSAAESLSDAITAKNQAESAAAQAIFAKKACQDSATAAADAADAAAESAAEIQGAASQIQANADAIQHISIAYDMMMTITQAEARAAQDRIATLEQQMNALTAN